MKDLTCYHYKAIEAFFNYLKNEDKHELIFQLCSIQSHARTWGRGKNKHIWFRFFHGYTLATTINDIIHDLDNSNKEHLLDCMRICVDTGEVEVYYS